MPSNTWYPAEQPEGPITDYGVSMVQWMRHRQPRYKGGVKMEVERPSPSYVIDVRSLHRILKLARPGPS